METEKGISIVEIIFSVGVVVLVITGTISLMVKSTGVKTSSLQRKNASEIAEIKIEDLIYKSKYQKDLFWDLQIETKNLGDYRYSVGYSQVTTGSNCSDLGHPATCVNAVVNVGWGNSQTLVVTRFFSK